MNKQLNKTLILTGWSKNVYMTAAAAALEALKWKADVAGVSMDALAGALKDRAPNYKTVFVVRPWRWTQEEHRADNIDVDGVQDQGSPDRLAQFDACRARVFGRGLS